MPRRWGTSVKSIRSSPARHLGLLALAVGVAACAHKLTPQQKEQAQLHYEIALRTFVATPPAALKEVNDALAIDPSNADAWHLKGLLMQLSFKRFDEAKQYYLKALTLRQPFPEAEVNLGNTYMDEQNYDAAIRHYRAALAVPTYQSPYFAHANLGAAYMKLGDTARAFEHLEAARVLNPKFCIVYLKLAELHRIKGQEDEACKSLQKMREVCPDSAEAHLRGAQCHIAAGQRGEAMKALDTCVEKAKVEELRDECKRLRDSMP